MSDDDKISFELGGQQEHETDHNHGNKWHILEKSQQAWKTTTPIFLALLLIVLVLILILQSVTVYHLKANPAAVCPEATTSASNTGDTGAFTGGGNSDGAATSECHINVTELLTRLNQAINTIEDSTPVYNETQDMCNGTESTDSAVTLIDIVGSLSVIKDNSITTEGVVNDILKGVEELLMLHNTSDDNEVALPRSLYTSCQDVKDSQPNSLSGYYHINNKVLYCEIGNLCGFEGGWTRLAHLNMFDSTVDCPLGFGLYASGDIRACGRPSGGPSCASVKFPSNGISYSEVCGRVVGYQYGSPDAVSYHFNYPAHNDINSYYVDGVSITRGSPRKHVWTLIGGVSDSFYLHGTCPCNRVVDSSQQIQSFVGNNYFCESGNHSPSWTRKLYTDDPLWDGKGCGYQETTCCAASGLPWFYRTMTPTTDHLELRVCGEEHTNNEDVPVGFYEIYVK